MARVLSCFSNLRLWRARSLPRRYGRASNLAIRIHKRSRTHSHAQPRRLAGKYVWDQLVFLITMIEYIKRVLDGERCSLTVESPKIDNFCSFVEDFGHCKELGDTLLL